MAPKAVSLDDKLIPLGVARRELIPRTASGRPVSPSTLWRWHKKGLIAPDGRRVRLRITMIGGRPYVSKQALEEFFAALTPETGVRDASSSPTDMDHGESVQSRLRDARLI